MRHETRSIPLYDGFAKTDLSSFRYRLIGLVSYTPMAGQGDVEHCWVYLCENARGEPVLITEKYDISVYSPGSKGPDGVSRDSLYMLEEEPLSRQEFQHYRSIATPLGGEDVHLPITLCLPQPPVPTEKGGHGAGLFARKAGKK